MQHREQSMSRASRWLVLTAAVSALLPACAAVPEETAAHSNPVEIEQVEGSELARLSLTEQAAERLDIQTAPVDQASVPPTPSGEGDPVQRLVVPYAAVLYDRAGETWAYTSPEPLVFVRHAITVEYIDDERAVLSAGPDVGTPVVIVGATELFGAEVGVDH